jgi:hypothetical protein
MEIHQCIQAMNTMFPPDPLNNYQNTGGAKMVATRAVLRQAFKCAQVGCPVRWAVEICYASAAASEPQWKSNGEHSHEPVARRHRVNPDMWASAKALMTVPGEVWEIQ